MNNIFPFPGHDMILPDIVRAENCSLFDSSGTRYVDMESGVWCTSIGHNNPVVSDAIRRQGERLSHVGFNFSSRAVDEAAGRLLDVTGHANGRCTFLCSGSEAVEYGVRIIRTVSDRPRIMTMGDSYFGAYGDAAARREDQWHIFDWFDCEKCDSSACDDSCPRWASIPFGEIGAFLIEPGSSSGFVRFPPSRLVHAIAQTVRRQEGLIMANEVTTGIGRTGRWFGFEHYDLEPDIIAMGKGVGNGYPVSVSSINARTTELLGGKPIAYGVSHLNDPLGAAVADAVTGHVRENGLVDRAAELSDRFLGSLHQLAEESPRLIEVRGRGLMVGAVFEDDQGGEETTQLQRRLAEHGFIVGRRPGTGVLRLDPALTVDAQDLDRFVETLRSILATP